MRKHFYLTLMRRNQILLQVAAILLPVLLHFNMAKLRNLRTQGLINVH